MQIFEKMPKTKSRSKQNELRCREMSHDLVNFPTGKTFKSEFLNEVVQYHCRGKANVRTGKFEWRLSFRGNRVLHFEESKGVWNSISWKNCAQRFDSGKKKTSVRVKHIASKANKTAAMRHQIFNHTRLTYVKSKGAYQPIGSSIWLIPECPECEHKHVRFEVDHNSLMFCEIRDQFLQKCGISLDDIKVKKKETVWFMTDEDQFLSWQQYHDDLVDYQILCHDCHKTKTKLDLLKIK